MNKNFTVNNFGSNFSRYEDSSTEWDYPIASFDTEKEAQDFCDQKNGKACYKTFRVAHAGER